MGALAAADRHLIRVVLVTFGSLGEGSEAVRDLTINAAGAPYDVTIINRHHRTFTPSRTGWVEHFNILLGLLAKMVPNDDVPGGTPVALAAMHKAPRWTTIDVHGRYMAQLVKCIQAGKPMQGAVHAVPGVGKTITIITLLCHPTMRGLATLGVNLICSSTVALVKQHLADIDDYLSNGASWWRSDGGVPLHVVVLSCISVGVLMQYRVAGRKVQKFVLKRVSANDDAVDLSDEATKNALDMLVRLANDEDVILVIYAVNRSVGKFVACLASLPESIIIATIALDESSAYCPARGDLFTPREHVVNTIKPVSALHIAGNHQLVCDADSARMINEQQAGYMTVVGDTPINIPEDNELVVVPASFIAVADTDLERYRTSSEERSAHLLARSESVAHQEERAKQLYRAESERILGDQHGIDVLADRESLLRTMMEVHHWSICRPPKGLEYAIGVGRHSPDRSTLVDPALINLDRRSSLTASRALVVRTSRGITSHNTCTPSALIARPPSTTTCSSGCARGHAQIQI